MRTTFIGGGVMAEAMLKQGLAAGVIGAADVRVAEPVEERRTHLASTYGVGTFASSREAIAGSPLLVLAVKPQHLGHVFEELSGAVEAGQTILSIAAGVPIAKLVNGFAHPHVIRVMPNTPAQIGAGVSVWTATEHVPGDARAAAAALLGVLGLEIYVADEGYLDMATAVSGSGPGYVFAFIEAMVEAAVYLGMPRDMATSLAVGTVAGSGKLAQETGENPTLLRERVTSPGGTTAEGLKELERGGFRATILEAVTAAHRRAKELGGNS